MDYLYSVYQLKLLDLAKKDPSFGMYCRPVLSRKLSLKLGIVLPYLLSYLQISMVLGLRVALLLL